MLFGIECVATALIILSQVLLGWRKRYSFLIAAAGNLLWVIVSLERSPPMFGLCVASVLFCGLSVRNWILWGKNNQTVGVS